MAMARLVKCCALFAVIFGIALIVVSILGFKLFPKVVSSKVEEKIALHKDSDAFGRWAKLTVPMYMKFYFFDVLNVDEVLNGLSQPIVAQKGPYVFRETREKTDIDVDEVDATITYQLVKGFYFVPEMSVGPLNDTVTVVDVTTATLVRKAEMSFFSFGALPMLNKLFAEVNKKAFQTFTIEELIYGHSIAPVKALDEKFQAFGLNILKDVPKKFGLLYDTIFCYSHVVSPQKNLTADGVWIIDSGIRNINNLQKVLSWKDQTVLNKWKSPYCNMINGTDGSRFHPNVQPTDVLRAFTPDICRSITLSYEQKSEVEGIKTLRFRLPEKFWAAPNKEPDNKCFCSSNDDNICDMHGIMDISKCRKGAPVFISGPHFFKGDQ
ncbi:platelet glycoprotein 4-like protein, partial [Leptotrombidium deliense]